MPKLIITFCFLCITNSIFSQPESDLEIQKEWDTYRLMIFSGAQKILSPPKEGLWSIATSWNENWPSNWRHASPSGIEKKGEWTILSGRLSLEEGDWILRDAYRQEGNKIKCIRRFEWTGEETLEEATLSIRWVVDKIGTKAFLPGIT